MGAAVTLANCISLEERVVLTSALQAHGYDAVMAEYYHSTLDWEFIPILSGRITVSEAALFEAQKCIIELVRDSEQNLQAEFGALEPRSERKDRWKVWIYLWVSVFFWILYDAISVLSWLVTAEKPATVIVLSGAGLMIWLPLAIWFIIAKERTQRGESYFGFSLSTPRSEFLDCIPFRVGKRKKTN